VVPNSDGKSFLSRCLMLDIETRGRKGIFLIGALGRGRTFERKGGLDLVHALNALDAFSDGFDYVLGHNLLGHDLPVLEAAAPRLRLLRLPVVDTLYLSPIAFPENPYHRLVKDYKLVRDSMSDPVADARLAAVLFEEQCASFLDLRRHKADVLALYRYLLEKLGGGGLSAVFEAMGTKRISEREALNILFRCTEGLVCGCAVRRSAEEWVRDPGLRPALAYAVAWLQVSGHTSVLPPWVHHRFSGLARVLRELRDVPCKDASCAYCRTTHDPAGQLRRFFGFPDFRHEPVGADGEGLQEAIVRRGMAGLPLLAILPTGAGKSLCYQLPALVRNLRLGTLTVVISPLQALMKDQVDGLARRTGTPFAAALYGMLTPPERGEVLERVRLGDIAILYVSPEQLRNRSFAKAISQREIGCWVFDEVHCLSKWGHDFRPDYLYAARFIREFSEQQGVSIPPVAGFTATAKPDVVEEILAHFGTELGQDLAVFETGVQRENLRFEVQTLTRAEKPSRIHQILSECLSDDEQGSAVVYAATRKQAEEAALYLERQGWPVEAFHAGLSPLERKRIQEAFLEGGIRVVCATNAFGMGIDKEDVRLVIHASIPGSIENYLQEAGRAGRDWRAASCVLLYDEQDIETQFQLSALSRLSRRDIAQILRGLRRARRNKAGEVVITAGELLRDEEVHAGFDYGAPNADTRVRTAVAWLERAGFVERNQNDTRVFQGRPMVRSMEEAELRLDRLNLSAQSRKCWLAVLETLMNAKGDEGISADELAELPAFKEGKRSRVAPDPLGESDTAVVLRTLDQMSGAGIIKKRLILSAFVRHKVANSSREVFARVCGLERAMLTAMQEEEPDPEGWQHLSLRLLNQRLLDRGQESSTEILRNLLKGLALDGCGLAGRRGSIDLRYVSRGRYRLRLQRDWDALLRTAERRRDVARVALEAMLSGIPQEALPSAGLLVEFSVEAVAEALRSNMFLAAEVKDPLAAIDRALLFLHEQGVIALEKGLAVFRQAMTIRILPEAKGRRYGKGDYRSIEHHYRERVFQVHVMDEYARLGLEKIKEALGLVAAYFSLDKRSFVKRYFPDRRDVIERATGRESYRQVVEALENPEQMALVAAPLDENNLVLAGPGAGKTRVVVHRCAYLLRVARVPARSILILCFNRSAAVSIRRRLKDLVGEDGRQVTVQTYHGLAVRLTGRSFAERADRAAGHEMDFDRLIPDAIRLLKGEIEFPGMAADSLRECLLSGYSHILVDEYQDIDDDQYELVSAVAGRTLVDPDARLTIMAVGDDDQNIYTFRGANVAFIRRFKDDYRAEISLLVENYRSSGNIIEAANQLIGHNRDRMKTDHPIRVNRARRDAPAGGAWAGLDPVVKGRVEILGVEDAAAQAEALVAEMERIKGCKTDLFWQDMAVLSRTRQELAPVRALLEYHGIPVRIRPPEGAAIPLPRLREVVRLAAGLKDRGSEPVRASGILQGLDALALDDDENPWWAMLRELIEEWRLETGDTEVCAREAVEFIYEALCERRREQLVGSGVLLSTAHGAKGMEFPVVFILGGGWSRRRSAREREEERRLYYVAMTRARELLCLFERRDAPNPHTERLSGDFLIRRSPIVVRTAGEEVSRLRYSILGMRDLFLDYAGRRPPDDPVHQHLFSLRPRDRLELRPLGRDLALIDEAGATVAVLSQKAREKFSRQPRRIANVRVLAVVERRASDCGSEFAGSCRIERWEVPLSEVVYEEAAMA
jgi:ATP-dependent DNA helicase RecQ